MGVAWRLHGASQKRASRVDVGIASPIERFVWPECILPGPAMMLYQENTALGGIIGCCKEAGTSLLHCIALHCCIVALLHLCGVCCAVCSEEKG